MNWIVDDSRMKLGALPPKVDARTLKLSKYLAAGDQLPTPPAARDWETLVKSWGMMLNDKIGDCTCAAAGHIIQQTTTYSGRAFVPSDSAILEAYCAVSGYNPATGANDNGAALLDVLKFWRNVGIGGHKIGAFVETNPAVDGETKSSIDLFGSCYVGVNLPYTAQRQQTWDVPWYGPRLWAAPGTWGGHCVPVVAYDSTGLVCVTWGDLKRMTWRFFHAYCCESYALLTPDWFDAAGKAPNGIAVDLLTRDLSLL